MGYHEIGAFIKAIQNIVEEFAMHRYGRRAQLGLDLLIFQEVGDDHLQIISQFGQLVLVNQHLLAGLVERVGLVGDKAILSLQLGEFIKSIGDLIQEAVAVFPVLFQLFQVHPVLCIFFLENFPFQLTVPLEKL